MRVWLAAAVVASLALAGAVQAQAQTGAWKVGSGTPVTLKGSNPATGEPNSSSLAVGCNLRTGRIYGSVSVIPFSFPNGKAVLTWDEREDVLRTFEGLEGFDYPTILLLTEDLSFLDNIIGHNRLTVSAEVEIEGRRARMESRFDLSGSQAAFRTISCWPPPAQAQAQTGAWKVGSGTPVTLKGSNPATGEPNSSSLAVGCNLRTGRIYGSVSVIPFSFPNGKAVLTWDEREDVLRTFEGLEGFDYPTILLLTEDLSFLDNIIGHNRLTVSAEVEIEGRRARMESRFDLSGSQAAFRTISCWPPPAQAQAQTGAWKVGSGTPVTLKGSNPATGEPNSSSLAVGCNLRTGRIYGSVSVIPFSFPNGKAVLTWDEREDVLRTFEGLEGFDYPTILLLTEDLSFLDNIIGHNRLTVSAEVEIEGRRARMESRFDLSGSQAAFRTISCWPPPARPAPSNPPSEALEPSGSPASGNLTAAQRNAVRSANSYLQLSGFSRQGLIDQLSSEVGDSYSVGDATVAVNSLSTDWNAQAARSAVSYLELSGFSCRGLIDQLSSEAGDKYTVEQATYGATQAGIC